MPRKRSVPTRIFHLVVFVILETAAFLVLSHNNPLQRFWLSRISHGFMAKTWGTSQSIRNYFSLKQQNDELALENNRLEALLQAYEAERALDRAGGPALRGDGFKYTPATIIKSSSNSQHNYIILDKGSDDGIVQNSGIITSKGVVGIVDAVSRHYSYAISFLNTELNIRARLGNEGAVGPLAWDGRTTDKALLREIPLQFKFAPGDTVYTSGYSAIFPADIPLGITGNSRIINGATNESEVTLFQDHSALK